MFQKFRSKVKLIEIPEEVRNFYRQKELLVLGFYSNNATHADGYLACLDDHGLLTKPKYIVTSDITATISAFQLSFVTEKKRYGQVVLECATLYHPLTVIALKDMSLGDLWNKGYLLKPTATGISNKELIRYQEAPFLSQMGYNNVTFYEHYKFTGVIVIMPVHDVNSGKYNYFSVYTTTHNKILDVMKAIHYPFIGPGTNAKLYPLYENRFYTYRYFTKNNLDTVIQNCSRFYIGNYVVPDGKEVVQEKGLPNLSKTNALVVDYKASSLTPINWLVAAFAQYQIGEFVTPETTNLVEMINTLNKASAYINQDLYLKYVERQTINPLVSQKIEQRVHFNQPNSQPEMIIGYEDCMTQIREGLFEKLMKESTTR